MSAGTHLFLVIPSIGVLQGFVWDENVVKESEGDPDSGRGARFDAPGQHLLNEGTEHNHSEKTKSNLIRL